MGGSCWCCCCWSDAATVVIAGVVLQEERTGGEWQESSSVKHSFSLSVCVCVCVCVDRYVCTCVTNMMCFCCCTSTTRGHSRCTTHFLFLFFPNLVSFLLRHVGHSTAQYCTTVQCIVYIVVSLFGCQISNQSKEKTERESEWMTTSFRI